MESDFENRELTYQTKLKNLEYREKKTNALESRDLAGLSALNSEISLNLEKLEEEDAKVLKAQEFIVQEKEELDKSTKMLQGIFAELSGQRKKLMEDQIKLELEKEKFIEVVGRLEEESKSIAENEEIVASKMLEMQKKELELGEKELELLEKEQMMLKIADFGKGDDN
jgi:hypothetical protein